MKVEMQISFMVCLQISGEDIVIVTRAKVVLMAVFCSINCSFTWQMSWGYSKNLGKRLQIFSAI